MTGVTHITDESRRARLVVRHHLRGTASDPETVTRDLVAVHSSDPLTPYLAMRARISGFAHGELDASLYETRTLWRLHAMRRTLFVVPADHENVVHAAAAAAVAMKERRKLESWVAPEIEASPASAWIHELEQRVERALDGGRELPTSALAGEVPELATEITLGSGKWSGRTPLSSRLLFLMAMEGRLVRGRPLGSWRSSQYRWARSRDWFGTILPRLDPARGRAELARRYLAGYGPVTLTDLRWWAGWTKADSVGALHAMNARSVALDSGEQGFVLPGDTTDAEAPDGQVAFLPALDPTTMGWKERGWYLGEMEGLLFDRNGNAGPTVWLDGRVIGGWAQRPSGEVAFRLLTDPGPSAAERVEQEAGSLSAWLGDARITPRFRTPVERELTG